MSKKNRVQEEMENQEEEMANEQGEQEEEATGTFDEIVERLVASGLSRESAILAARNEMKARARAELEMIAEKLRQIVAEINPPVGSSFIISCGPEGVVVLPRRRATGAGRRHIYNMDVAKNSFVEKPSPRDFIEWMREHPEFFGTEDRANEFFSRDEHSQYLAVYRLLKTYW